MASNDREERRLMRQRGAGTHQLADVSFGIDVTLPSIVPPQSPRATRSTPRGQAQPTPATNRRQGARRNTPRSTPQEASVTIGGNEEQQPRPPPPITEDNAPKRRKLLGPASVRDPSAPFKPPSGSRSTRSSGPAELGSLPYRSPRTGGKGDSEAPSSSPLSGKQQSTQRKGDILDLPDNKVEEAEPQSSAAQREAQAEASKPKKPGRRRKSDTREVEEEDAVPSRRPKASDMAPPAPPIATRKPGRPRKSDLSDRSVAAPQAGVGETNESIEPEKPTLKKRKSGRPRKSDVSEYIIESVEKDAEEEEPLQDAPSSTRRDSRHRRSGASGIVQPEDDGEQEEADEDEETEHDSEEQPPAVPSRPRGRPRQSDVTNVDSSHEARQPHTKKTKEPSRKRGRPSKSDGPARGRASDPDRRNSARDAFPIVVHRLSTHHKGDYDGPDAIYNPLPPNSKRGGVNAVDVLSQLCRELIYGSVQKLQEGAEQEEDESRVGEWKRKRKAVESFGEELEERLFEMTEALDYNHVLLTRVRKANKKKLILRERLLEIRREREQVALKMDEVRRAHEEGGKAAEDFETKNSAFHDIELAIERGKTRQQQQQRDGTSDDDCSLVGLEVMLKTVADDVSSTSDAGSLLGRIKAFNGFLERAAAVLEGRA